MLAGMAPQLPESCQRLLGHQHGVIARSQAARAGLNMNTVHAQLRSGRWRPLYRGVYATFTGEPTREALLWAAVLRAGPRAILSHESAAELDKLADGPSVLVHVTVPLAQHMSKIPGVIVHRSVRFATARHPAADPPRTMIEETVLDLAEAASTFDEASRWLGRACARGLTTPRLIRMRMDLRKKLKWRAELARAVRDVERGAVRPGAGASR